ncbi:MAG: YfhO family protein [bacterium]
MKSRRKDIISILLLFSVLTVFFGTVFFTDATFHHRDIAKYYYPTKYFASESLQEGVIPFWNPYIFCGTPFLATLQHGFFYPLSFLHYLLPFDIGFKYFFVVHFFLAALFFYLLMKKLGLGNYASGMAALIFSLSGYLVSMINLLTTLSAVIWVPLALLLFMHAIEHESYIFGVFTGLVLALEFFSGQPEVVYMTGLIIFLYAVFHISNNAKGKLKNGLFKSVLELKTLLYLVAVISTVFIFTVLVQIIPFLELIKYSSRTAGVGFKEASYWSFHPLEFMSLLLPSFSWNMMELNTWFRQYWLRSVFVGIWPLMFVLASFFYKKKDARKGFFIALGFIGLVLSMGKYIPLYSILYASVPGLNFIRYPVKFIFLFIFALAALSAIGLQCILDEFKKRENLVGFINTSVAFFLILLFLLIFSFVYPMQLAKLISTNFLGSLSPVAFVKFSTLYIPKIVREMAFVVMSLGIGTIFMFLRYKGKITSVVLSLLMSVVVLGNLFLINFNTEPLIKSQFYTQKGMVIDHLRGEGRIILTPKTYEEVTRTEPIWRDWNFDSNVYIHRKSLLLANIGWIYHIFDAGGYASMRLKRYNNFMTLIQTQPTPTSTSALDLLSVRHIISLWNQKGLNLDLLYRVNHVNIYENKGALQRVSVFNKAIFVTSESDIPAKIQNPLFNPHETVIIEAEESTPLDTNSGGNRGEAIISNYSSNEVLVEAAMSEAGWLLLTDTFYPGWSVYVNGEKSRIYPANYLFRGVHLEAGGHRLRFVYEPTFFKAAFLATAMFLIALVSLGLFHIGKTGKI